MRHIIILFSFILLTSCGFRPLSDFENKTSELQEISLGAIKGENDHLIKNYLNNALNFYNEDSKKLYIIDVSVNSNTSNAIIQKDSTIVEKTITITSTYSLKDTKTMKVIDTKTIVTRSNFTNTTSPYGSFVQEQKAYRDALKTSIDEIKKHLLLFFAKKHKNQK